MKIIFICGSVEPGKDGVGDYVRRLAGELMYNNHLVSVIALNDDFVDSVEMEYQSIGNYTLPVLRLPKALVWKNKYNETQQWLLKYTPDYISVQFVPFAFDEKGLPFLFSYRLKKIAGKIPIHIMFHELWVGVNNNNLSFKQRILQHFQKGIIFQLIKTFDKVLITTSIEIYQKELALKKNVALLNLFGNIPFIKDGISPFGAGTYNIIHFGTFSNNVNDIKEQLKSIYQMLRTTEKVVKFYSLGNGGANKKVVLGIAEQILGSENCYDIGRLTEAELSNYFFHADIGISRADIHFFGKSGSTIAMLEHGLPVVLRGENKYLSKEYPFSDLIYIPSELGQTIPMRKKAHSLLEGVANQLISVFR